MGFPPCDETIVEGLEVRVGTCGAERRHVEGSPEDGPTALNSTLATMFPAVVIEGCQAGESRDFFVVELTEFRQLTQDGGSQNGTDAFDLLQVLRATFELFIRSDELGDVHRDFSNAFEQILQMSLEVFIEKRVGGLAELGLGANLFADETFAIPNELFESNLRGAGWLLSFGFEGVGKGDDDGSINGVGFSEMAGSTGKIMDPAGIGQRDGTLIFEASITKKTLVSAGGFANEMGFRRVGFEKGADAFGTVFEDFGSVP